jgi:two-component system chemotaxis sensor kinase CheA
MNLEDALPTFIAECRELLDDMEAALLSLDTGVDAEVLNAIFRAAHTIKGSAGLFGLDHVVAFTHVAESVLDEVRAGHVAVQPPLVALLLGCCDHMRALTDEVAAGRTAPDAALERQGEPLLVALRQHLAPAPASTPAASPSAAPGANGSGTWHLSMRFGAGVLRNGMDPLSFIRYLGTIGEIRAIVTLPDALPAVDAMDPECCYLGFELAFETQADKAQIESVFEFVLDDIALHILPPASRVDDYVKLIESLPEASPRLGEILARCGSVTEHELQRALASQALAHGADAGSAQRLGEILVAQSAVTPAVVEAALDKQQKVKASQGSQGSQGSPGLGRESQSVRVDSDKLDRLIDLVGELIIAQAGASLAAKRTADLDLHEAHSTLAGLVQEVRDSALQLRMVKIGATFNRFQRVVHDVSRELGKDIALVIKGEDTELDKTVVEKIGDPLTHLVRNAMDHGIGLPEQRRALGQPERGTITLEAYHDAGNVVIEVSDDGQGLNRERILAKGIERGLVEPDRTLSDAEIYNLIFEPGFSTAEKVTNLSGRGVGMDVVKRNITALRGTVGVSSRPGLGTTVTVRLPLTLAIIDGFQVGINKSVFVVPLDMVEECVEYRAAEDDPRDYTDLRGHVLPFIRLRELFELGGTPSARQNIVVLRHGGQKVGLVVDGLLGEAQTVIKPLSKMFAEVRGISGSSIRGTGEVALILDVPALIQHASRAAQTQFVGD